MNEIMDKVSRRRPALRRNEIVDSIHGKIIDGRLRPNDRIPTRRSLQMKFNASMVTVQQAISQLLSEGFLESRGVEGTFVSSAPPHLSHYAVVVDSNPVNSKSPMFWRALTDEFSKLNNAPGRTLKIYYCPLGAGPSGDFISLSKDVERHCVAGLIFIDNPFPYEGTALICKPGIPRVAVMGREGHERFNTATVTLRESFISKALDYFSGEGRRKVALITNYRKDDWWQEYYKALAERGMETRPYWIISSDIEMKSGVRNLTNLLLHLPEKDLPDAILISDDNLAEPAIYGLLDSGSKAVGKLRIVSHCNFPMQFSTPVQVKLLGPDSRQIIDACMKCLERQKSGEKAADVHETVELIFEDERKSSIPEMERAS